MLNLNVSVLYILLLLSSLPTMSVGLRDLKGLKDPSVFLDPKGQMCVRLQIVATILLLFFPSSNQTVNKLVCGIFFRPVDLQGPPGKDGLPGHPGQRGETVSRGLKRKN